MSASSRWRFKKDIDNAIEEFFNKVDELGKRWAQRTVADDSDTRDMALQFLKKNPQMRALIDDEITDDKKRRRNGEGAIDESFRALWAELSAPEVIATNDGWQLRRALLGSICGPRTTYADAKEFVQGELSREAFYAAQERREEAMASGDVQLM